MEAQKVTLAQREMQNVAEYCYLMTYDVIKYRKLSYNRILSGVNFSISDTFPLASGFCV
jgi:hypothetical protein